MAKSGTLDLQYSPSDTFLLLGCSCALCFDEVFSALSSVTWLKFYEFFAADVKGSDQVAAQLHGRLKESGLLTGKDALPPHQPRLPAVMHSPISSAVKATPALLEYAAAAWQLTRGEYDYFGASTGWLDGDWGWLPVYSRLETCGPPQGPPKTGPTAGAWTRKFDNCTVQVDTNHRTGSIRPATGPRPSPSPLAPPPRPPALLGERVDVFSAGDAGDVPCFRIPALLYGQDGSLLAFAEARSWLGDNCWPARGAAMRRDNTTSIVLRRSTSQGRTWGSTTVVAGGDGLSYGDFAAVSLANGLVAVTACTGDLIGDVCSSFSRGGVAMVVSRAAGGRAWGKPQALELASTAKPAMASPYNPTGGLVLDDRVLWCGHAREQRTKASYVSAATVALPIFFQQVGATVAANRRRYGPLRLTALRQCYSSRCCCEGSTRRRWFVRALLLSSSRPGTLEGWG